MNFTSPLQGVCKRHVAACANAARFDPEHRVDYLTRNCKMYESFVVSYYDRVIFFIEKDAQNTYRKKYSN